MTLLNRYRDEDLKLLARYLAGECDTREAAAVRARLAVDEEAARTYETIKQIWETATPPSEHIDKEAAWQRLQRKRRLLEQRAEQKPGASLHRLPSPLPDSSSDRPALRGTVVPHRKASRLRSLLSVVALLVVAGLGAVVAGKLWGVPPAPSSTLHEARVYETTKGQRATIQLTDGTRVHLNVDSRLTVPVGFAEEHRTVHLQGEAFLDVVPDSTGPFIIEAEHAEIRVLGTAFDVRTYPDEEEVQVVVAKGTVVLGPRPSQPDARPADGVDAAPQDTVILNAGELGRLGTDRRTHRQKVDLDCYMAWRAGRLVFKDAPFDVVARELSRWYDLQVDLVGASPQSVKPLKASFGNEPLSEILNVIAAALDLEYEREHRRITFRPQRNVPDSQEEIAAP